MPDYLTAPKAFDAAADWLARKVNMPTDLGALDISNRVPAQIRGQAFFSAKIASGHVLDNLRKEVERYARGDVNLAQARERMKTFLARAGYGEPKLPGSKEDRDLRDIASTRRLDLIIKQNTAMAQAVGQRAVAEMPEIMEYIPNYQYDARNDARPSHARFDGLILPKTDPFWDTHYPPWDYNCRCMAFDTDEPINGVSDMAAGRVSYGGRAEPAGPNESGFEFLSNPKEAFQDADFSSIEDLSIAAKLRSMNRQANDDRSVKLTVSDPADRPVKDAIKVKNGPLSTPIRKALKIIDQVHKDGILPTIPAVVSTMKRALGTYRHKSNGQPVDIRLSKYGNHQEFTVLHEVGHFLDHHGIGQPGTWGSRESQLLQPLMNLISKTQAVTHLNSLLNLSTIPVPLPDGSTRNRPVDKGFVRYLLQPEELFARCYAQYIAVKSVDNVLLQQLDQQRAKAPIYYDRQWENDDFLPLLAEMDRVLSDLKWR